MSENDLALLDLLANRLADDPEFIAWALARYCQHEGLTTRDALAIHLRTTRPSLTQLALCKRPPPDANDFGSRVRDIACFAAVDAAVLANLLRQVEFLQGLPSKGTESPTTLLAAARDRVETEAPPRKRPNKSGDADDCDDRSR